MATSDMHDLTFDGVIETLGEKAIAQFADDLGESDAQRFAISDQLMRLLNRLAVRGVEYTPGDGTAHFRWSLNSVARTTLAVAPALVERLKEHRLIKSPSPSTIKLTHEVILIAWSRARSWASDQDKHLEFRARLTPLVDAYGINKAIRIPTPDQDAAKALLSSSLAKVLTGNETSLTIETLLDALVVRTRVGLG